MALRLGLRHELSPDMTEGERRSLIYDLKTVVENNYDSRLDLGNFVEDLFEELDRLRGKTGENSGF